jgi:DNA replication protein DnaC
VDVAIGEFLDFAERSKIDTWRRESPPIKWLIKHLIDAETTDRAIRSIGYQMNAARFPIHRSLADFDFDQSKVDESLIKQLATFEFTDAARNVVLVGGTGTGTGKSHLATANVKLVFNCINNSI